MRVDELREREDFPGILASTLAIGWSIQHGGDFRVTVAGHGGRGQLWRGQSLLSAYYVDGLDARARRFLRNSFRYTPVRRRLPLQWALGTLLGSRAALGLAGIPGFRVEPDVPEAQSLLVLPGNQRIRILDFRLGTTRVLAKTGFDRKGMQREIAVRSPDTADAPFPRITAAAADASWFEEPIVDAYALPRCPPWISRARATDRAFDLLGRWLARDEGKVPVSDYCTDLEGRIVEASCRVSARFGAPLPDVAAWCAKLSARASGLESVPVATTHGDFQPGNILVHREDHSVTLIDWEHSARRFLYYDQLVFGLASRSSAGLGARVTAFLDGRKSTPALDAIPSGRDFREPAVALFLLEDLAFYLTEALTGPYAAVPRGLRGFLRELAALC